MAIQEIGGLRINKQRAGYELDRLRDKRQAVQREREECANAVNPMRGGVGELHEL